MRTPISASCGVIGIPLTIAAALLAASCATVRPCCQGSPDTSSSLQLEPQQSAPLLRLARASRANGDFASAINLFRSVISGNPADAALAVEFGDTLIEAGSIDDGIDVYQRVPRNSASRLGALLGLEQAYLLLAETDKALQYAEQANTLAPQDQRVMIGRGVALDMVARHSEAQESYRAVLEKAPHDVAARNDLALSLALTQHYSEAIDIMTPMARSSTVTPRIRQNLALIYGLAGDSARAAAWSRMDLDAKSTDANLAFFDLARDAHE